MCSSEITTRRRKRRRRRNGPLTRSPQERPTCRAGNSPTPTLTPTPDTTFGSPLQPSTSRLFAHRRFERAGDRHAYAVAVGTAGIQRAVDAVRGEIDAQVKLADRDRSDDRIDADGTHRGGR